MSAMRHGSALATATLIRLGEVTNRTLTLPLVIFYPTSRCNSRCTSCDWWTHSGDSDLTIGEIAGVASSLADLGTRLVVFSGGEPLLRPDVFEAAGVFRRRGMTLHLLTSGVLLERLADGVARVFARVTISLDATTERLYEQVRGIPALKTVERGVHRLRSLAPSLPITARATLHRANFKELSPLIARAKALGLDGISFLAADVSSLAFGRARVPDAASLGLSPDDVDAFEEGVERTIAEHRADFDSGFVAESPDKLRRLPRYYAALAGDGEFPAVTCNAPWVSIVVEADGRVRPCFFHESIGNVRELPLATIVASNLRAFRRSLTVGTNPVCRRCVCSLNAGWRNAPWA
jgi:MoaA/NifB/PqqE/SkfB family radical SAM enzyme